VKKAHLQYVLKTFIRSGIRFLKHVYNSALPESPNQQEIHAMSKFTASQDFRQITTKRSLLTALWPKQVVNAPRDTSLMRDHVT
jgi:hypothetical protein